jgi:glycosyltransferase involved in cell wall biosynthesis
MKTDLPLVNVIAVSYNHSRFIRECLDGIHNQSYNNIQLIIIDDCSTDNSVDVIRKWISENSVDCKFISHKHNKGIIRTLNEALSYAKGKYVSIIATDDVWLPGKTEHQVKIMEQLPEDVGVLYTDAYMIDEEGNMFPNMFIERHRKFKRIPEGYIFHILADGNFIPAMTVLVRRACYDKVGLYDERLCFEDYDMWLRISQFYKFAFSSVVLTKRRVVSNSLQQTLDKTNEGIQSKLLIWSKLLRSELLKGAQKKKIQKELARKTIMLYKRGASNSSFYLRIALRQAPSFKILIYFLISTSHFPYIWIERNIRRLFKLFLRQIK